MKGKVSIVVFLLFTIMFLLPLSVSSDKTSSKTKSGQSLTPYDKKNYQIT